MLARLLLSTFAVLLFATPAACQATTGSAPKDGAPRLSATVAAVRRSAAVETRAPLATRTRSKPVALMIVGGAAIIIGSVLANPIGTLFAIGGAVAFLIGLYQYLQ